MPRTKPTERGQERIRHQEKGSQEKDSERRRTDVSNSESENPVIPSPIPKPHRPRTNQDWRPNQPDLQVLRQHSPRANPLGEDFNYAEEFKSLDLEALKRDVTDVMTKS